jgi:hypothetical protein
MKKLLLFIGMPIVLASCSIYSGVYNVGLTEVESPSNVRQQYGETKVVNFQDEGVTKYSYADSLIRIIWLPMTKQFSFNLTNNSKNSIKIIWDEAVYVDIDGSSHRVMHTGVKYIDRDQSQPPTIVVKGANVDDIVIPTDNVYYVSGQYGGWFVRPLFKNTANTAEELEALKTKYVGGVVKVLLPLKIEETTNEYLFTFKIEDFLTKK